MARSTCTKCGEHRFELVEHEPSRANFKYNFIQCAACGGVAGVVEAYYNTTLLHKIMAKLGIPLT